MLDLACQTLPCLENISTLGWGLVLIVALGGVVHLVKTWAWRLTLTDCRDDVSFTRMLQLRLASEAAGQSRSLGPDAWRRAASLCPAIRYRSAAAYRP
jgi:hypothetical protein